MAVVDELVAVLGFDLRGEGDLRRFNEGMDRAERNAQGFAATMGRAAVAAGAAFAAFATGGGLARLVSSLTSVNAQFETYEATLRTITGSAEEASRSMDWISDFARTTPYEAAQVTQAFVRLKAYGLDPMDGTLRTVGDAASAMGKNIMDGVEAIADAITGENERLKEFGVRTSVAGDQVTYTWTQNGEELSRTVSKNATEIQGALLDIFSRFNGAMDEQSKTWVGMTSNLAENWTDFLREIGEAGYYDEVKRRLQGVLDTAASWWEDGRAGRAATAISDLLVSGMDTAEHLARQAYAIGRGFYNAADGVVELASRLNGLSKSANAIGLGAAAVAATAGGRRALMAVAGRVPAVATLLLIDDIITQLDGGDSAIGQMEGMDEAFQTLGQRMSELSTAANDLATSLNNLFSEAESTGEVSPLDLVKQFADWRLHTEMWLYTNAIEALTAALRELNAVTNDPIGTINRWLGGSPDDLVAQPVKPEITVGDPNRHRSGSGKQSRLPSANSRVSGAFGAVDGGSSSVNLEAMRQALGNLAANTERMTGAAAQSFQTTVTNQDQRDQSIHVGAPNVSVTVQQPSAAPAAVGRAVGDAIGKAAVDSAARVKASAAAP